MTNRAPDGSYSIAHYLDGQLQSVIRKDFSGTQLSQTSHTYDAHGRQNTASDARNGTTTFSYDDVDRVISVTSPAPGTGQGQQTTSYTHDYAGHITRTIHADGTSLTNEYFTTGELKKTTGSRVYPVEYKYDSQGRMTNMTTWKGYPSSGSAATTWKYDAYRGFLTNKVYDGHTNGIAYTYTKAGRLRTRAWERGITTTYVTNAAGDTVQTSYSDGATSNVVYNLDRPGPAHQHRRWGRKS